MRTLLRISRAIALGWLPLLCGVSLSSWTQAQEGEEKEQAEEKKEEAGAEKKKEEKEEEEEERWYAIVGGDVYTGDGAVLRGATVLAKNGVIEEIGHDLWLPEGTEKLDARGMRVYPGLVALSATTRITRGLFSTGDEASEGPDETPHEDDLHPDDEGDEVHRASGDTGFDGHIDIGERLPDLAAEGEKAEIEDTFDPFSEFLVLALATGITCAEQSDAAVKLKRNEIDGILLREKYLTTIAWSHRNPASIRSAKEKFEAAAKYLREYRDWQDKEDKNLAEPDKKSVDTSTLRVLRGERLARFNNDEREDLLSIARLAQRYGFRPVIFGCREGWTVADELGRAGAFAVITPRDHRPKDEELVRPGGSSIENAAKLHQAGVQVAVIPTNTSFDLGGITGHDLLHLPVEAAFAVRGGLSNEAALQSLTLVPARILGVDNRIGTLEKGKDLDAIVTDGDVLHYQTFVQYAVVDGKLVYDKEKELFYAHIRPRPTLPPLDAGEAAPAAEPPAEEQATEEKTTEEGSEEENGGEEEGEEESEEGGQR